MLSSSLIALIVFWTGVSGMTSDLWGCHMQMHKSFRKTSWPHSPPPSNPHLGLASSPPVPPVPGAARLVPPLPPRLLPVGKCGRTFFWHSVFSWGWLVPLFLWPSDCGTWSRTYGCETWWGRPAPLTWLSPRMNSLSAPVRLIGAHRAFHSIRASRSGSTWPRRVVKCWTISLCTTLMRRSSFKNLRCRLVLCRIYRTERIIRYLYNVDLGCIQVTSRLLISQSSIWVFLMNVQPVHQVHGLCLRSARMGLMIFISVEDSVIPVAMHDLPSKK